MRPTFSMSPVRTQRWQVVAGEKRLKRSHARADHKQRRVVLGDKRRAFKAQMAFFLGKKIKVRFAEFVAAHVFQFNRSFR